MIVNFANADMVGHSGRIEPTVKAVETVDACLGRIESAIRIRVVSCAHLGRTEEGREWLERLLEIQPGLTIARYKAIYAVTFAPKVLAVFVEGFRKVGLPEE